MSPCNDSPSPAGGGNILMVLCCATACLGSLQFGMSLGFTSLTSDSIQKDLSMSDETILLAGSLITVGCAVGAILSGFLDFMGRRGTAMFSCIPMAVGSLLAATTESPAVFCVARVVSGVGVGLSSYAVPLVIGEASTPATRGLLLSLNQTCVTAGILISMVVGGYFPGESPWRSLAWMSVVPAVLEFMIFLTMVPESPRWLLTHDKPNDALVSLRRLRVDGHPFEAELLEVVHSIRASTDTSTALSDDETDGSENHPLLVNTGAGSWESPVSGPSLYSVPRGYSPAKQWGMILTGHSFGNIVAAVAAQFIQALSGINAVVFWAGAILKNAGYAADEIPLWSVCFCAAMFIGAIVVAPIVDKVGRKPLFAGSQLIAAASLALLAFIPLYPSNEGFWGALPAVGITIFEVGFSLGLGPIPWVLVGEIIPLEVRAAGVSMASTSNWVFNFIVVRYLSGGSVAVNFSIFSGSMVVAFFLTTAFMPETKGLSLAEACAKFSNKTK